MSAETEIPSSAGSAFTGRWSNTIELRSRMVDNTSSDKSSTKHQEQYPLYAWSVWWRQMDVHTHGKRETDRV